MDKNCALMVAGVIFAIVSLLHLLRLVTKFNLVIGSKQLPLWFNVIGFIVAGFLAFWMFAAAKNDMPIIFR